MFRICSRAEYISQHVQLWSMAAVLLVSRCFHSPYSWSIRIVLRLLAVDNHDSVHVCRNLRKQSSSKKVVKLLLPGLQQI